jgi:hypothetical protein
MTSLLLRVSPQGKRSGLVSLPDGVGGVLTVAVMPKIWSPAPRVNRRLQHLAGTSTNVVCYELDTIEVLGDAQVLSSLALNLASLGGGRVGEYELIEAGRADDRATAAASVSGSDPVGDLIALLDLAERGGVRSDEQLVQGALAESLTRVLTYERFLRLLEPLIFRSRPRYIERQEALSGPRGRLDDRSLLLARATGMPLVECIFDDLTMDTPLLQVMYAALTAIASDRLPRSLAHLARPGAFRASNLRRHLAHVSILPRETARLAADRIWLGPLDRHWDAALEEAKKVLDLQGYSPETGSAESDGFAIHVLTERCWEYVAEQVLMATFSDVRTSADRQLAEGVEAPRPWRPATGGKPSTPDDTSFPDFMLRYPPHVVVADAKYKLNATVGAGDGYQLFAYSHLATLTGTNSDLAVLLFPAREGVSSTQSEWVREDDSEYKLWAVQLTVPSRRDVATTVGWRQYLDRAAAEVGALSTRWSE